MKAVLTTFNSKYIHSSLALYSVASFTSSEKCSIKVIEHTLQTPILKALSAIYKEKPVLVGIAVYIWNRNISLELASMIKQVLPKTKIVLGGPEVSFAVEETFADCPSADFILQGEGEVVFQQLIENLAQGQTGKGIKGLAWQDDNKINLENGVQVVADLNILDNPYDFIDIKNLENRILYYETTRGCPFSCSYCLSGISHNVRYKNVEKVIEDLDKLIKAQVKQVKFVDRTYNLNKNHYLPIMRWLAEQNTKTNFHFEIKADNLDEETLDFLAHVPKGRFQLEIGIQSIHTKTLQAIGRQENWDKSAYAIKKLRQVDNMHIHLDLICGLPYEGLAEFAQSINNVYALKPHMLQIGFLKLLKGSILSKQADEHGYLFMQQPVYEILSNKYITYDELRQLKLLEEVFEQTYNTGKFFHTLDFIINNKYNQDAYTFYKKLVEWWEKQSFFEINHSIQSITSNIFNFIKHQHPEIKQKLKECLKVDILLYHEKSFRPDYLDWLTLDKGSIAEKFWRDEETVRQYLPNYKFSSWRNIKSSYQLEIFTTYFPIDEKQKVPVKAIFDLEKRTYKTIN